MARRTAQTEKVREKTLYAAAELFLENKDYLLQELECSVTFIVIAGMVGNVVRLLFSVPMGRYADRFGFDRSVALGFGLAAASNLMMAFWTPANGAVLYLL